MESHDHEFHTTIPVRLPFRAFLPTGYSDHRDAEAWPMILFLHGSGERGEDLAAVVRTGLPERLARQPELPFLTIVPQCPPNLDWSMLLPALDALVSYVKRAFLVDPDRVYLTGLSMGGYGCWAFASSHPEHFAAVAPICGGGDERLDFPGRLRRMARLPVWCFHGEQDEVVPVEETLRLVGAFRELGGEARCTLYPGVGHDSWTRTYDDPELYAWLLGHVRGTPAGAAEPAGGERAPLGLAPQTRAERPWMAHRPPAGQEG
ncbi:Prolyl oligopeptidase family serine peptidase [Rhodovastum atsumiense]|nr:prolyl oligopeptidase family serine peptidase [Rhodovastum atsumiense]CAH2602855.1 Prolyl oligopeptidase family serine peptidase [Rhodovastum atsumiense]